MTQIGIEHDSASHSNKGIMLDFNQAVEYLQVSRTTIKRLVDNGALKAYRVGIRWRFYKSDLDAAIVPVTHKQ